MKPSKIDEFLIEKQGRYIENINRISDDLLKAKWYFLASLSAIGLAYTYTAKSHWTIRAILDDFFNYTLKVNVNPSNIKIPDYIQILLICIIGNIIFS
jgi:hypothetical protein